MFRVVLLSAFVFFSAVTLPKAAEYRLLRLEGQYVKWGAEIFGARARVTYSFANRRHSYPTAINCKQIGPVAALLEANGLRRDAFRSEVEAAFRMWSSVADIDFVYVVDPAQADIVIGEQVEPRGVAYANVWPRENGNLDIARLDKALICLNPREPWETAFDGKDDTYSIRQVVAHEIGHTIGLNHPGRSGQLMGYQYSEEANGIRAGDVRGAEILYGPRLAR